MGEDVSNATRPPSRPSDNVCEVLHTKFHLPVHILKCQTNFSFNFSKNVGHTDGEAPEHGWSNINPMASSTKAMGPGSQRDTLNDHFGDWNWKKVVGLVCATLLCKMSEAKEEQEAHQTAFQELNEALEPAMTESWKVEVESWEENPNDPSVVSPFEAKVTSVTQAAIWLRLAQLKASELYQETDVSMHADVSPSIFIASWIDLKNEQRCLKVDIRKQGLHTTDTQMAASQWLRNSLQLQLLESTVDSPSRIAPDNANLWLPSALCGKSMVPNAWLLSIEWELQYAQAGDALEEIRQSLRLHGHMYSFKWDWIHGQNPNTQVQNTLSCVEAKAAAAAEKYRAVHTALSSLAPILGKVSWNNKFKVLNRHDDWKELEMIKTKSYKTVLGLNGAKLELGPCTGQKK
ncbi:hypothetical protein BDR07DRAFT_1487598 [Suillus spraguei]|nr:hypothetical protein BDR07DRAFT_1487598 [Suillus spraguei]